MNEYAIQKPLAIEITSVLISATNLLIKRHQLLRCISHSLHYVFQKKTNTKYPSMLNPGSILYHSFTDKQCLQIDICPLKYNLKRTYQYPVWKQSLINYVGRLQRDWEVCAVIYSSSAKNTGICNTGTGFWRVFLPIDYLMKRVVPSIMLLQRNDLSQ